MKDRFIVKPRAWTATDTRSVVWSPEDHNGRRHMAGVFDTRLAAEAAAAVLNQRKGNQP